MGIGFSASISIVNCVPNVGVMHFQSNPNAINSKFKKMDLKSMIFGAGLGSLLGLAGIHVAGLVGSCIGKGNGDVDIKCAEANLDLSKFKDCSFLER